MTPLSSAQAPDDARLRTPVAADNGSSPHAPEDANDLDPVAVTIVAVLSLVAPLVAALLTPVVAATGTPEHVPEPELARATAAARKAVATAAPLA